MSFGNEVNKYINTPGQGNKTTRDNESSVIAQEQVRTSSLLNFDDIGVVTSRDQIIDPYALVNIRDYRNNAVGQAQYNADLAQAQRYAELQEASYQEWYNSPEQVALRERAAGRNPDLVEPTGSEASDTSFNETSPFSGIPTNQEIANQTLSSISGIVGSLSSVASLATCIADIPLKTQSLTNLGIQEKLLGLDLENSRLNNLNLLKSSVASDIGDLLGTAMQAHLDSKSPDDFDLDGWFSDSKNFEPLDKIYSDNPRYSSVLSSQKSAMLRHYKNAVALQKDTAHDQYDFGLVAGNPRYSSNQKVLLAQFMPVLKLMNSAEESGYQFEVFLNDIKTEYANLIDVSAAASSFNNQNRYTSDYYSSIKGNLMAQYDKCIKSIESHVSTLQKDVFDNLHSSFMSDPSEFFDSGLYLIGEAPSSWQSFGLSYFQRKRSKLREILLKSIGIDFTSWDLGIDDSSFWQKIDDWFNNNLDSFADSVVD